jgi:hypothetical protein
MITTSTGLRPWFSPKLYYAAAIASCLAVSSCQEFGNGAALSNAEVSRIIREDIEGRIQENQACTGAVEISGVEVIDKRVEDSVAEVQAALSILVLRDEQVGAISICTGVYRHSLEELRYDSGATIVVEQQYSLERWESGWRLR